MVADRRITLVRHGPPQVMPDVDSKEWGLASDGFMVCARLARALPEELGGVVWTSSERKAVETGRVIANIRHLVLKHDERFGEVERPWTDGDYRATATAYLAGEAVEGWEPRDAVVDRFTAAVDGTDGDVVIVNHGLAMSLYIASVTDLAAAAVWESLRFPDAYVVSSGGASPVQT